MKTIATTEPALEPHRVGPAHLPNAPSANAPPPSTPSARMRSAPTWRTTPALTAIDIREAYKEHLCTVFAVGVTMGVRRPSDLEDLGQDVFRSAWQQLDRYDPAKASVRAWLTAIAVNRARNWRRRTENQTSRFTADPDIEHHPAPTQEQRFASEQLKALTRKLLDELPAELRLPLEFIDFHHFTHEETAGFLNLPIGTVGSRYYKAQRELQKKIDHLLKTNKLVISDVFGLPIPIPADVPGMLDTLRTSDLAVDSRTADRIWNRVLSEPSPEEGDTDSTDDAPPDTSGNGTSDPTQGPAATVTSHPPPHGNGRTAPPNNLNNTPAGPAGPNDAAHTFATLSTGAKLASLNTGAKLAGLMVVVASAAGGAGLHAIFTPRVSTAVVATAETAPSSLAAALPTEPTASAQPTSTAPAATSIPSASVAMDSETSLMNRMHAAAGRPQEVLTLAARHQTLYPKKNALEREALVILALAHSGRKAEAKSRLNVFAARYPQNVMLQKLRSEVGETTP